MRRWDAESYCRNCGAETSLDGFQAPDSHSAYAIADGQLLNEDCCDAPNPYLRVLEPWPELFEGGPVTRSALAPQRGR